MSHGFQIHNVLLMNNLPKLGSKHHSDIKNGLSSQNLMLTTISQTLNKNNGGNFKQVKNNS